MSQFVYKKKRSNSLSDIVLTNHSHKCDLHVDKVDLHIDEGYGRCSKKIMKVLKEIKTYTEDRPIKFTIGSEILVIGVADGHGGSYFYSVLASGSFQLYFLKTYYDTNKNIEESLLKTFDDINMLANKYKYTKRPGGTTLNCCVIDKKNNKAYIANLGDSVTNIFRKIDGNYTSVFRSVDHDAESLIEQERIKKIYYRTTFTKICKATYLICCGIETMVTGAIGNFDFPDGLQRKIPDISCFDIQKDDVIIVSSDGYYEEYSTIYSLLGPGRDESQITRDLIILEEKFGLMNCNISKELFDLHIEQNAKLYIGDKEYDLEETINNIKTICDNNTIITHIV
jgi:serine/threonine protein phosphatase PrpC